MAIAPLGGGARFIVGQRDKSSSPTEAKDDSDAVEQGQGVIDNTSEYASMAMLAASHVRRRGQKAETQEEWTRFSERILDGQADEKILRVEAVLNRQLMTPQQLRAYLRQFFADPSDLLMALAALIHRSRLKQKQLDRLKALQKLLQAEDVERRAEAGINIALIAKAFAQKMQQSAGDLRMLYREFLRYEGPVIYLYEQWAQEQEMAERENIMRYLARALACDLQALPSGNTVISEFGRFFNRVSRLREMQSLEGIFKQRFQQAGFDFIGRAGEQALSKCFTSGIRGQDIFNDQLLVFFTEHLGSLSTDMRARFLQIVIMAFSMLPTGIFTSLSERENLLNGLKENMDHLMRWELTLSRRALLDGEENI